MIRLIRLSSVSKEFFDLLDKNKRQKKAVSITKLAIVSVICFFVIGLYALRVNQASTKGYFLKQETKKYDALVFQRSIVQLDNLQLEKKLYEDVFKSRNSRYEDEGRRIELTIGKPEDEQPILAGTGIDQAIDLGEAIDLTAGSVTVFEYEE